MAKRYDVENLVKDISLLVKTYLNDYVARIEAEQIAAGLGGSKIEPIDPAAYHAFSWNDGALNHQAGVMIFPQRLTSPSGDGTLGLARYTVDVGVYLGTQNDPLATLKVLRYSKALEQIFMEKWGKISNVVRENIETVEPLDFKLSVNSSDDFKIAGVVLAVTLG